MSHRGIHPTSRLLRLAPALCLACLYLGFLGLGFLVAAEKNREWQTGQVVEPKGRSNARAHAIAGADKIYFVRGNLGDAEDGLAVGAMVRFAVQGSNMFLSIGGKEYRVSILGTTLKPASQNTAGAAGPSASGAASGAITGAASPEQSPTQAPVQKESEPSAPAEARPPAQQAAAKTPEPPLDPPLDNDAIVKMALGGLKEETIVQVIEARPGNYVLTPESLAALKAAGVPQGVIAAMTAKMRR
ncbi:MAG TPA: hypothetical protein VIY49_03785 [Bryobacteraceae bacterium]